MEYAKEVVVFFLFNRQHQFFTANPMVLLFVIKSFTFLGEKKHI